MHRRVNPGTREVPRPLSATIVLVGLLLLTGCQSLFGPRVESPDVTIDGLTMVRPGLLRQDLAIELRLRNREARDLAFDRVSFTLDLGGQAFASGAAAKRIELPAGGETVVAVPFSVETARILSTALRLATDQRFDYALTGTLGLAAPDAGELAIEDDGELELPSEPAGLRT